MREVTLKNLDAILSCAPAVRRINFYRLTSLEQAITGVEIPGLSLSKPVPRSTTRERTLALRLLSTGSLRQVASDRRWRSHLTEAFAEGSRPAGPASRKTTGHALALHVSSTTGRLKLVFVSGRNRLSRGRSGEHWIRLLLSRIEVLREVPGNDRTPGGSFGHRDPEYGVQIA